MAPKDLMKTETVEFRQDLFDRIVEIQDKRSRERVIFICVIIGAIATILGGVWVVLDLKFYPIEKRLDKIEQRLDVMDTRIKRKDELCYLIDERIRFFLGGRKHDKN